MQGIGKISAMGLLTLFTTYKDANRAQITALAGLDPKRKKISKSGNKIFRKILYFPMLTAIRYDEKIKKSCYRLVESHKPKKLALIVAMRKMTLIAHAVYKNKTMFYADL